MEEKNTNTEKRWYCLRIYSGHEYKVKSYIENEAKIQNLSDRIFNVLIPSEKVFEIKNGKKKTKVKNFFPGYILVETMMDKEVKHLILNTPSVLNFVGSKDEPVPLQQEEVKRILGKIDERKNVEISAVPFRIGDPVKVTSGPFSNFNGFIQEVNEEKMKVKVMVSIFGRKTPIELDFSQIELEK
jgi:transcription termination/antitermination protein NusG